jgi:hypothetical protein
MGCVFLADRLHTCKEPEAYDRNTFESVKEVKGVPNRPGISHRFPGGLGSHIFRRKYELRPAVSKELHQLHPKVGVYKMYNNWKVLT